MARTGSTTLRRTVYCGYGECIRRRLTTCLLRANQRSFCLVCSQGRCELSVIPHFARCASRVTPSLHFDMKRRRSSPRSSPLIGDDPSRERNDAHSPTTTKVQRASAEPGETHTDDTPSPQTGALKCSLPPTCSGRAKELFFSNVADMERHHATYHTHTCLDTGCGKVFPDARFLTLVSIRSFINYCSILGCNESLRITLWTRILAPNRVS